MTVCIISVTTENIGFCRIGDNRWITQYEALFCVLNAKGQVLTWRLTPRLSFAEIEGDLVALKRLTPLTRRELERVLHRELFQVFGGHLIVYLDIFHAVKRFSEKVPKWHPLRWECIKKRVADGV